MLEELQLLLPWLHVFMPVALIVQGCTSSLGQCGVALSDDLLHTAVNDFVTFHYWEEKLLHELQ